MFKITVMRNIAETINSNDELRTTINSGGCGVFAVILAKKLQSIGITPKIVVFTYNSDVSITKTRKTMNVEYCGNNQDWYENGVAMCHVMVEFEHRGRKYQCDAKSVGIPQTRWSQFYKAKGALKLKEMELMTKSQVGWNNEFDRKNIPKLKRIVNEHFGIL